MKKSAVGGGVLCCWAGAQRRAHGGRRSRANGRRELLAAPGRGAPERRGAARVRTCKRTFSWRAGVRAQLGMRLPLWRPSDGGTAAVAACRQRRAARSGAAPNHEQANPQKRCSVFSAGAARRRSQLSCYSLRSRPPRAPGTADGSRADARAENRTREGRPRRRRPIPARVGVLPARKPPTASVAYCWWCRLTAAGAP
jgi:hypothetical protein